DAAGSVYATGYATSRRTGTDCVTIKYNSEGTQQWTALYNGTGNAEDKAFGIVVDNLNNIYVTGYSVSPAGQRDIITIKYNSSGENVWDRSFDGPAHWNDEGSSIATDASGNI